MRTGWVKTRSWLYKVLASTNNEHRTVYKLIQTNDFKLLSNIKLEIPESTISTFDEWIRVSVFRFEFAPHPVPSIRHVRFLNWKCSLSTRPERVQDFKCRGNCRWASRSWCAHERYTHTAHHRAEAVISLSITRHQHPLTIKWFRIQVPVSRLTNSVAFFIYKSIPDEKIFQYFVLIKWMAILYY